VTTETVRPYHHGNLRSELLEHAERVLASRGAGALSLRELAREIGVSHAAPRRHFADKQALLDALAEDGFDRLGVALRSAVAEAPAPAFAPRLTALAKSYIRFATEHAALLEVMFAVKHRPGAGESLAAAGERAFEAPLALVAGAQAAGEIVPGDPERVSMVAWAALQGLAMLANSGMIEVTDELVAGAVERLVLGLRPR
jgi:AcrR family transcriptional regulator